MKLSKRGMYYRAITRAGAGMFALAIVFPPALLLIPIILLVTGVYEYVYWKNFDFFFDQNDMKIRSGVVTKNELDIPIRRIQDIDTKRNVIERALGITRLNIKTAGGNTSKASLKYLDEIQADHVREKLRELKNRRKDAENQGELVEQKNTEEAELFYDIEDALTTYSLVSGFQGLTIVGIILLFTGIGFAGYISDSIFNMIINTFIAIIGSAIISLFVLISGFANTYSHYYDFKVERKGDTFEYERGLFNKQGGSIPEEKIQKIQVTENFLMRYLGYASLKVETAGYTSSQDQNITSTKTLIPLDKRRKVYRHAERLGKLEIDNIQNIAPESRKRYTHRYAILWSTGLIISSILVYLGFHPGILVLPLAGILTSKKAANKKWINIGFSLGDRNLIVRKGFWNRRTYAIEYFRFQNLIVSESVFQRRWGLASLTVDTAGDKVVNPSVVDLNRNTAFKLRDKLYHKFRNSIY